ncbi:Phenylalanyl-tRNA synthetase, beta subunit, cytoplasmic [Rhodotorula toruloides]
MSVLPPAETLQSVVLHTLDQRGTIPDTRSLALALPAGVDTSAQLPQLDAPEAAVVGPSVDNQNALKAVLDSLAAREMVTFRQVNVDQHVLTSEGSQIAQSGSHEYRVWSALPPPASETGLTAKEIEAKVGKDTAKVGQGKAMKNKWVVKKGDGFLQAVASVDDVTQKDLLAIQSSGAHSDEKLLAELRKRKLIEKKKTFYYSVEKGPNFATTVAKLETDLTVELLSSGAWEQASFKKYNFEAEGAPTFGGALHPLMKVREEFRNIFFEMGFTEMPTNRFVESSFWNFDTLYVPQQHPAREMQDTFYVKDPVESTGFPGDYYERVKRVHEVGDYGSTGYRYPFSKEETSRLVLRTHTTSVSSAQLYQLANQPGGFKPAKMFSIDRVFRNEAVDMTHLAEFHQVEGVVADYNLTLADLIGFMEVFFSKMGVKNLRFKPAYNPYTEPSLEIFSWHEGLGKWVEIGNSGMFRPEMLETMGLPADVRVLGFGLSLERPTMIRYGISNIRDLLGHKVPLEMIEKSAAYPPDLSSRVPCVNVQALLQVVCPIKHVKSHSGDFSDFINFPREAAAAAGAAGRNPHMPVSVRRYSTAPSPPSPPPERPSNRLLPLTAGFVLLAGGAYLYLAREEPPLLGYDRWTPVKIKSITPLTPETSFFRLEVPKALLPPGLGSDPSARPILSLFVKEPNLQIQRAYTPLTSSSFNPSGPAELDLVIKRYADGELSRYIHRLGPGDELTVRGPAITWYYRPQDWDEVTFVVGGTGVAPAYQFVKDMLSASSIDTPKVSIVYASPSPSRILLKDSLDAFREQDPSRLSLHYLADRLDPNTSSKTAPQDVTIAFPDGMTLKKLLGKKEDGKRRVVIVCGPEGMVEAVAGPRGRNFSQGRVGGVLKELGFTEREVVKL